MARQMGPNYFIGRLGGMIGYQVNGVYYSRQAGAVSKYRILNNPRFEKTRINASYFARAIKLAKIIYNQLPPEKRDQKKVWYPLRNRAQDLLRAGGEDSEVLKELSREFVNVRRET